VMATSGISFVRGKGTAANLDLHSLAHIYLHELIREIASFLKNTQDAKKESLLQREVQPMGSVYAYKSGVQTHVGILSDRTWFVLAGRESMLLFVTKGCFAQMAHVGTLEAEVMGKRHLEAETSRLSGLQQCNRFGPSDKSRCF
jgi:hypothetical protein